MTNVIRVRLYLMSDATVIIDVVGTVNQLAAIQHVNRLMRDGSVGIFSSNTSRDGWVSINMAHVTHAESL